MDDKQARAAARKKALKELLEGVTTRNEGRNQMYLMAAAAALIVIGVVFAVLGLVHLVKPDKNGGDAKGGE